ncbi:MAG: hypothetical protein LYZ70_01800 [Nitrososphaerales archaeon]|nr:hypothetical protein [Nitrososphaerales archaeon]
MNRGLALFSFFLIVLGAGAGFYPVSVLGILLLIPALVVPSRRPLPRPQTTPPERRRPAPAPSVILAATTPQSKQETPKVQMTSAPTEEQRAATIPALFPTAMFPSMFPSFPTQQAQERKPAGEKPESRDEVLELAALVAILRLVSG